MALPAPAEDESHAHEPPALLGVDKLYLRRFVATAFEYKNLVNGGDQEEVKLRAQFPFGYQNNQSVVLNIPYRFVHAAGMPAAESMADVETTYVWLFDTRDDFVQGVSGKVEFPTNGDRQIGGTWTLEGTYGCRWLPADGLIWLSLLHYNKNLTNQSDYVEGESSLFIALPAELTLGVGTKLRYVLSADQVAPAVTFGLGRSLDEQTTMFLSCEQPLNTQARSTFEVFRAELSLTRRF